jgi:hypothetical protein
MTRNRACPNDVANQPITYHVIRPGQEIPDMTTDLDFTDEREGDDPDIEDEWPRE